MGLTSLIQVDLDRTQKEEYWELENRCLYCERETCLKRTEAGSDSSRKLDDNSSTFTSTHWLCYRCIITWMVLDHVFFIFLSWGKISPLKGSLKTIN